MKTILFGANDAAHFFVMNSKVHVDYAVDNSIEKIGGVLDHIPIYPVRKLVEEKEAHVIIMMYNDNSIREALAQLDELRLSESVEVTVLKYANDELGYVFFDSNVNHYKQLEPHVLHLGLSDICNLKCVYCAWHGKNNLWNDKGHFMSMETAERIADAASKIKSLDVLYITHNGEDFLNKDWLKIVNRVLDRTSIETFEIYTNGLLLDENNIHMLKEVHCKHMDIVVSIDGQNAVENDRYRIGSNYELIKQNLVKAVSVLGSPKYRFTVNNNRVVSPEEVIGKDVFGCNLVPPDYLVKDFARINVNIASYPTSLLVEDKTGKMLIEDTKLLDIEKPQAMRGCLNPFNVITINAKGEILLCGCNPGEDVIGNIEEDNLYQVWLKNERMNMLRKSILSHMSPGICKNCPSKINGKFKVFVREPKI